MRRPIVTTIVLGLGLAVGGSGRADPASDAATALTRGQYQAAVDAASAGLAKEPKNPWLHYEKGCALVDLGSLEDGIAELRQAQRLFAGVHEQGLAIYRIAVAEETAKRCPDAQRDFAAYAALVRGSEPQSAELAKKYADTCGQPPEVQTVSGHDKDTPRR